MSDFVIRDRILVIWGRMVVEDFGHFGRGRWGDLGEDVGDSEQDVGGSNLFFV